VHQIAQDCILSDPGPNIVFIQLLIRMAVSEILLDRIHRFQYQAPDGTSLHTKRSWTKSCLHTADDLTSRPPPALPRSATSHQPNAPTNSTSHSIRIKISTLAVRLHSFISHSFAAACDTIHYISSPRQPMASSQSLAPRLSPLL
jgi:hypothetical protein